MNRVLADAWASLGADPHHLDRVVRAAGPVPLPARLAVGELAEGAVAAAGLAGAVLHAQRCAGDVPFVDVDPLRVAASFTSDRHLRLDGQPLPTWGELSGFWPAADGWVRTHANYPHHRARLLRALGLADTAGPDDLATAIAALPAREVEDRVAAGDGIAVAFRSRQEWAAHPQAAVTAGLPVVDVQRLGDADAVPLPALPGGDLLPASGVRVLDLTRVIAGPVATRTLALLGAQVLRVDPPDLPELPAQHLDNGAGKRSALLNLRAAAGRSTLERLLGRADVVVTGYRPGALSAYGLDPEELGVRHPGLVVARLSAWGTTGPWGARRGFDSIVQAATGIAALESTDGRRPGALPAQALDHAAGHLLAAGILTAVGRRSREGGSWLVETALVRLAHRLLALPAVVGALPGGTASLEGCLVERPTPSGRMRYALPAVTLRGGPVDYPAPGRPWGVDPAAWG